MLQTFTGKERDAETGLDYFGARYFSGAMGRFTSPDAPMMDQRSRDPQSWNLYVYVRNNPLKNIDPDGHICVLGIGNTCNDDIKPPPPPNPPAAPSNPVYASVDSAGVAAARTNQRLQQRTGGEHASSIHTTAGGVAYTYTDPVTQGHPTTVDPHNTTGKVKTRPVSIMDPPIPAGTTLVGESHSHPDVFTSPDGKPASWGEQFSRQDMLRSQDMTTVHPNFQGQYLGLPDGRVLKYEPKAPPGRRVKEVK